MASEWGALYKHMRYLKFIIIFLLVAVLGYAAYHAIVYRKPRVVQNPHSNAKEPLLTAKLIKTFEFKVDSLTEPDNIKYYQLFDDSDKSYLTFLNSDIHTIYFYDLANGQLVRTIDLKHYGFELSSKIQGYYILNSDSILLYSYKDSNLSLLSITNGLQYSITMDSRLFDQDKTAHPFLSTRTPILKDEVNNVVYMSGFWSYEGRSKKKDSERNVIAQFSLNSGKLVHDVPYPPIFWGVNWGGAGGFRQAFLDMWADTLIVGFMADHNIHFYNSEMKEIRSEYFGSSMVPEIRSMGYANYFKEFLPTQEIYEYYLSSPSYSLIKFDKYRQKLYRVVESTELFTLKNMQRKRKSLLVMTKDFSIAGVWKIPDEEVDFDHMLIHRDGLLVLNRGSSSDHLYFNLYEL